MLSSLGPILVVEDHPLYREAVLSMLLGMALPEVITACTAEEGLRALRARSGFRLIVMDLNLPGLCGVDAIRKFRSIASGVPIVVLSASDERRNVDAALQAGASVFISKGVAPGQLRSALHDVLAGTQAVPIAILARAGVAQSVRNAEEPAEPLGTLTPRQRETLTYLSRGYSNKEIALQLGLAEVTVKLHVSAIFKALGVVNRTQAVVAARQLDLQDDEGGLQASARSA